MEGPRRGDCEKKQSYHFLDVTVQTFCSLIPKFPGCTQKMSDLLAATTHEPRFPGRYNCSLLLNTVPSLALSNKRCKGMDCSAFKTKCWLTEFTATKPTGFQLILLSCSSLCQTDAFTYQNTTASLALGRVLQSLTRDSSAQVLQEGLQLRGATLYMLRMILETR